MPLEDLLAGVLASFGIQSGFAIRPNDRKTLFLKAVNNAGKQPRLGSYDRKVDIVSFGKVNKAGDIFLDAIRLDINRGDVAHVPHCRVGRGPKRLRTFGALCHNRVIPRACALAVADNQNPFLYFHQLPPYC